MVCTLPSGDGLKPSEAPNALTGDEGKRFISSTKQSKNIVSWKIIFFTVDLL
jgi:hypothetical protein